MSINIPGFTPDLRNAQPSGLPSTDRIATALERIADALERAHPKFNPGGYVGGEYEIPEVPLRGYERSFSVEKIRAFLSDKPVGAHGRIAHGIGEACIHGDDHPDDRTCEYLCDATMAGHRCTRWGHADDRHLWAMTDEEYDRRREEAGVPREVFDDVRAWADGREAAQRRLTAGCGDCGGECGQLDGPGAAVGSDRHVADRCGETFNDSSAAEDRVWVCTETVGHVGYHYDAARLVGWGKKLPSMTPDYAAAILSRQTEADPLDEDDHRPRVEGAEA